MLCIHVIDSIITIFFGWSHHTREQVSRYIKRSRSSKGRRGFVCATALHGYGCSDDFRRGSMLSAASIANIPARASTIRTTTVPATALQLGKADQPERPGTILRFPSGRRIHYHVRWVEKVAHSAVWWRCRNRRGSPKELVDERACGRVDLVVSRKCNTVLVIDAIATTLSAISMSLADVLWATMFRTSRAATLNPTGATRACEGGYLTYGRHVGKEGNGCEACWIGS